jgi:hypothetical protein
MHRNSDRHHPKLKKIGKKDRRPKRNPHSDDEAEDFNVQD